MSWLNFLSRLNRNADTKANLELTRRTGADVLLAQMGEDARRQHATTLMAAGDVVAQHEQGKMELGRLESQEGELQQEVQFLVRKAAEAQKALDAAQSEAGEGNTTPKVTTAQSTLAAYKRRGSEAMANLRGLQEQIDTQEAFVEQLATQAAQAQTAAHGADAQLQQSQREKAKLAQLDAQRKLVKATNASMQALSDAQSGAGVDTANIVRQKIEGELAAELGDQTILSGSSAVQQVQTRVEMMQTAGSDDFAAALDGFIDENHDGIDDRLQRSSKSGATV